MKNFKMNIANDSGERLRFKQKSLAELKAELKSSDSMVRNNAYTLLNTRYQRAETRQEREEAGRALGYREFTIKIHEYFRRIILD